MVFPYQVKILGRSMRLNIFHVKLARDTGAVLYLVSLRYPKRCGAMMGWKSY